MRKIFPFIAGSMFLATVAAAAGVSPFAEANAKYTAGDFKSAETLYRKAIESGQRTAAAYYNLGNASFRVGKKGQALLAYERARKLTPRDRDLRWNLNILKNTLPDRVEAISSNPFGTAVQTATGFVSARELAFVFTGALGLLALLAMSRAIWPGSKRWTGWMSGLLWLAWLSTAFLIAAQWNETRDPRLVILDREVTARYGPSERETKAFVLHEGAQGRVIDDSKDWFYVVLENGSTGWVPKRSAEIV